ncbi:hypothetical protein [Neolewinella persica]|nr:hypothetical protein [Neolewinella persica]
MQLLTCEPSDRLPTDFVVVPSDPTAYGLSCSVGRLYTNAAGLEV